MEKKTTRAVLGLQQGASRPGPIEDTRREDKYNPNQAGPCEVRRPAAMDLLEYMGRVAIQASELAGHVNERLAGVMFEAGPSTKGEEYGGPDMPPLFAEFWNRTERIERALAEINYALERTGL